MDSAAYLQELSTFQDGTIWRSYAKSNPAESKTVDAYLRKLATTPDAPAPAVQTKAGHLAALLHAAITSPAPPSQQEPGVPTGLKVAPGDGKLVASWSANPDGDQVLDYQLYLDDNGTPVQDGIVGLTSTLGNLTNGRAYGIRLGARNKVGYGFWSGAVTGTPVGATPDPGPTPNPNPTFGTALTKRMPQSDGAGGTFNCASVADVLSALGKVKDGGIINIDAAVTLVGKGTASMADAGMYLSRRFNPANPVTIQGVNGRFGIKGASALGGGYTYGFAAWGAAGYRVRNFDVHDLLGNDGASGSTGAYLRGVQDMELENYSIKRVGGQGLVVVGAPGESYPVSQRIQLWNGWLENNAIDSKGGYYGPDGPGGRGSHHMYIGQDQGQDGSLGGFDQLLIANHVFQGTMPGYHIEPGPEARNLTVANCTFHYNHSIDAYARDFINAYSNAANQYGTHGLVVVNNVFYDSTGAVMDGSGAVSSISVDAHNNVYGQTAQAFSGGLAYKLAKNLMADPKLDLTTLHLLDGSPAIGYADPAYVPPLDHDGKARVTADCGAFAHAA